MKISDWMTSCQQFVLKGVNDCPKWLAITLLAISILVLFVSTVACMGNLGLLTIRGPGILGNVFLFAMGAALLSFSLAVVRKKKDNGLVIPEIRVSFEERLRTLRAECKPPPSPRRSLKM